MSGDTYWCDNRRPHKPHPFTTGPSYGPDAGRHETCPGLTWADLEPTEHPEDPYAEPGFAQAMNTGHNSHDHQEDGQ